MSDSKTFRKIEDTEDLTKLYPCPDGVGDRDEKRCGWPTSDCELSNEIAELRAEVARLKLELEREKRVRAMIEKAIP